MTYKIASVLLITTVSLLCGCGDRPGESGEVDIALEFEQADNCPSITWAVAAPAQTSVGDTIDVGAAAVDPDPSDRISFAWSPAERFKNPGSARAVYTCPTAGPQTLTLTVSDNHLPAPCATSTTLVVRCVAVNAGEKQP